MWVRRALDLTAPRSNSLGMKRTLLLVFLLASTLTVFAQTALKGTVTDEETEEPLPFATVQLLKNGAFYQGTQTDLDGSYRFANIDPGTYELQVDYTGYPPKKLTGVPVLQGKTNDVDVEASSEGGVLLEEIVVTEYKVPLIEPDNTTQGQTITAEQIRNLPTRNINQIASTVAGATSTDEGAAINIRGSRSNATDYYVDGVRVAGTANIPDSEIEQLQVVTGGIEARYGDVTGGIISITTKGFSDRFTVNAEAETSEFLDNYGNSLAGLALSGPLLRDKQQRAILGYRLSGRYTYARDDNPSAVPLFYAKDEVRRELAANPVILRGGQPIVAADFLTNDDVNAVSTRINEASSNVNLNGKLTARLSNAIDVSVTGAYIDGENQFTPVDNDRVASWQLFNYDRNPTSLSRNYRANLAFRHRLGGAGISDGDGRAKNLIQNASYDLQFTYENTSLERADPVHGDNFFDYGYVGRFDQEWIPIFGVRDLDTDSDGLVDTSIFAQVDYRAVLRGYDPSTSTNPVLSNYNNTQFDARSRDFITYSDVEFATTFEGDQQRASGINNFYVTNGLQSNLFTNSYGFWTNTGQVFNQYLTADNDRYTFQANAYFDVLPGNDPKKNRHSIQLGVMYEQRTQRSYQLAPFGLWRVARQLVNQPLDAVDITNRVVDSVTVETFGPNGEALPVYAPTVSSQDGRFFSAIRESLGVREDEFVNVDGLSPDQLSLDMFSPNELAFNGLLNYYGYDYLGNEFDGSFDDFFDLDPVTGERTFLVAPNRPIYAAAYLQDKFTINDMIFRLGVRIDRYDANTRVLKDPFSLYEIQTAGDFHGTVLRYGTAGQHRGGFCGIRDGGRWLDGGGVPG